MRFSKKRLRWYFHEIFGMTHIYIQCDNQKSRKELWRQLRIALDIGVHLGILKDYPWAGFPDDTSYGGTYISGPWKIKEFLDELNGYHYDVLNGGYCKHPDEYYSRWLYPVHKSLIRAEICSNLSPSAKKALGITDESNLECLILR